MTGSNGNYTFTISDIKAFYGLTDTELSNLTRLGFIAKNTSGGQTDNLYVDVVQGRRDAYSGGEGTAADPYVLKTAQDLQMLVSTPGDWTSENYFRMDADIDASALMPAELLQALQASSNLPSEELFSLSKFLPYSSHWSESLPFS